MPETDYRPTLEDVGAIDMARTVDDVGKETGTFSNPDNQGRGATRPTADQANLLIDRSLQEIVPRIGTEIPADLIDDAQYLVAMRTAMWIELTYYAAEVALDRSPYPEYKVLYDEMLPVVVDAVEAEEAGMDPSDALSDSKAGSGRPAYDFPPPLNILERPF